MKWCEEGSHEVPRLFRARGRDKKSACQYCAHRNGAKIKSKKPAELSKIKPIKKVSDKQAKINKAYTVLREQFLKNNDLCMAQLPQCTFKSTEAHHKAGRGIRTLDETLLLPVCRNCHDKIEVDTEMAFQRGFSIKRTEI